MVKITEAECELRALRAFADLVEVSVVAVEGKPWGHQASYWRPMINALRAAQGIEPMRPGEPDVSRQVEYLFNATQETAKGE